ncbi:MAG: fumarylacetoacetate hydrolase family protein [Dehalococcoidia bacterium]
MDAAQPTTDRYLYGVTRDDRGRCVVAARVGEHVLPLGALGQRVGLGELLAVPSLNPLLAAGPAAWHDVRQQVNGWLDDARSGGDTAALVVPPASTTALPFSVGDYADFYSARTHAENVSRLFRPGQPLLHPNWVHLPVGYHGRASTVVASGTPVRRPRGQVLGPHSTSPETAPSAKLDLEAEVGFVLGGTTAIGAPVPTADADAHLFGVVLLNDWSARDLQRWEATPLGPFLSKSFATSASAWVLPVTALEAARVTPPAREVPVQPYLESTRDWGFDIRLEVYINDTLISQPAFRDMYWTADQQLAHLTVNGAQVRPGDLIGSGTVSSRTENGWGSLLEISRDGTVPVALGDGSSRRFLEDGDVVRISASAPAVGGGRVDLADVVGEVLPARG